MTFQHSILACTLISSCLIAPIEAERNMTNPYHILEKHYEAVGGLDRLRAHKTIYKEGKIVIEGTGLKGTFKQWIAKPLRLRQEVDLTVVKDISGDNGEFSWSTDRNGKLHIHKDENTAREREVRKYMELYSHLDPDSPHFTLTFDGIEKVNAVDCYVISIANHINADTQIDYYDAATFRLARTTLITPDEKQRITYADFRSVDGVIQPFQETVEIMLTGETVVFEYSKYEFNTELDPSLFEPPHEDVEDFQFINGKNAEDVPCEFIENHIYLPVNIDGRERLWVLDCGASVNVIDSAYAVELGLKLEGPIKGQGASGIVKFYYVTLPPYSTRGIEFEEQKAVAMHMRNLLRKAYGLDVVGILGYDFLSRLTTKIDYANERLSFYQPEEFEYHGEGRVIDAKLDDEHMFTVPITVDNTYSGLWVLDIGASGLDFHYPYARKHNFIDRPGFDAIAAGAAGEYKIRFSQFKTIELAGFTVENPFVGIPYQKGQGAFAQESSIGNIGNSFLRHFVIYLDYRNQRVIVEKGDDYDREFPRGKSGLQFWYDADSDIEVLFVSPNTPGAEAGFEKGDIITAVNGIDVGYFDGIIAVRKLLREEAGTTYTIKILRNKKSMEIQLTLHELF